jgi:hypothetical protein
MASILGLDFDNVCGLSSDRVYRESSWPGPIGETSDASFHGAVARRPFDLKRTPSANERSQEARPKQMIVLPHPRLDPTRMHRPRRRVFKGLHLRVEVITTSITGRGDRVHHEREPTIIFYTTKPQAG